MLFVGGRTADIWKAILAVTPTAWTIWDTSAALLAVAMTIRILAPDVADVDAAFAPVAHEINPEFVEVLVAPIPDPQAAVSQGRPARLHAVLRCIGLAGAHQRTDCAGGKDRACEISTARANAVKSTLWPEENVGPQGARLNVWVYTYSRAYTALAGVQSREARESSELILRRDSAMCNRYREMHEARLHEPEDRQSG